jgi:hypothetical protein
MWFYSQGIKRPSPPQRWRWYVHSLHPNARRSDSSIESLITDLALAKACVPSFTLTSLKWLASILDTHPPSAIITHAHFVPQLLELIADHHELDNHTLILSGEDERANQLLRSQPGIKVFNLEGVEESGLDEPPPPLPTARRCFLPLVILNIILV